jgi:ABC-2 type transport system permease protein
MLGSPVGLAARLLRPSALGWFSGIVVTAAAYGSITDSINDFVADNEALTDLLAAQGGADLVDSYLAMSFRILALLAAAFGIQATLRLRSEELAHHAEVILSTPVSRARWGASHLAVALVGSVALLTAAGLAAGISAALVTGDDALVTSSVGAALAYAPACWVMVGIAMAVVGVWPRLVVVVWSFLGLCAVVGLLGQLLALPDWAQDLSPFQHVPLVPAHDLRLAPLGVLVLVAAAFVALGLVGLRRRDIA